MVVGTMVIGVGEKFTVSGKSIGMMVPYGTMVDGSKECRFELGTIDDNYW